MGLHPAAESGTGPQGFCLIGKAGGLSLEETWLSPSATCSTAPWVRSASLIAALYGAATSAAAPADGKLGWRCACTQVITWSSTSSLQGL